MIEESQDLGKEEFKIRPQTQEEKERLNTEEDVPSYKIALDLKEEDIERLTKDFFLEYDGLKEERKQLGLEDKFKERDRQYDGKSTSNERLLFNLNTFQSRIKVDAIARACNEAFLDSDPKFAITPRPEFSDNGGEEVTDIQGEFLDFAVDEEIKPEKELAKVFKQSATKYVGIQKLCWNYCREQRRREESYVGKNEIIGMQGDQPVIQNKGLESFLKAYPDAAERYPSYIKRLVEEKTIDIVVEYMDTVANNPEVKAVRVEDFYISNAVASNAQMRNAHCIAEAQYYSWWECLKKEEDGEWANVDQLKFQHNDEEATEEKQELENYQNRTYRILEGTYYWKIKDTDEKESKIKVWFSEDKKIFLGAILFPYYGFDCDYKAYWLTDNDKGFYGDVESVMWTLRDSNIAQNALLNLALHGTYSRNILTPIVKEGSASEEQLLSKRWAEGMPFIVDETTDDIRKEIGFMEYPQLNTGDLVNLTQLLKKQDADLSLVTDLMTGKESPTDPNAPATKTLALLEQSGIGIKDYIRRLLPTFNSTAGDILQLYAQMSTDEKKFRIGAKSQQVVGSNPFNSITRDMMVAKTNIQSRAFGFVFDKVQEKQQNLAMMQTLLANPVALQRPELLHKSLEVLLRSWSPMWKNMSDQVFPSQEEFQQEQMQVAVQALAQLAQGIQQQALVTGVKPEIDISMMVNAVNQAQQEAVLGAEEEKE